MSHTRKTLAGKKLSEIMANGYMDLHTRAKDGAFVVWIAINVPVEIFLGFDNVVHGVPESHAAMSAGKGVGPLQCEKAEQQGYSQDLCSYARVDLGTVFDGGKDSPTMGLPKPDLLISNNNNCSLLVKWFDIHHREWNIPHFIMDVPFCYSTQAGKDLDYITGQYRDLVNTIERMSGQTYHPEKVYEAVTRSSEATRHWKRFLECANHRPSGITAFDSFVQMAPFLTIRGTQQLVDHYKLLADETEGRISLEDFPVPNEKYRLLWDNIAPWHQLRSMSKRLKEMDANIVAATYTSCIGGLEGDFSPHYFDGSDPLRYLARKQNFSICPSGLELRTRAMTDAVRKLNVDGVIFASNRSCKVYSLMQMDQQKKIEKACDIPSIMLEFDHADSRKYSEENAFLRIEALLENINSKWQQFH